MNISADAFFSALAHPLRLRCLVLIEGEVEVCVCELTHALEAAQPTVSRHLAMLREAGIVRDRREGTWIHYRLNPDLPAWAREVLQTTARGLASVPPYSTDRKALKTMPNRPLRCCP